MLAGVKARVPEAWNRLVDVWGPIVYGWCRRHAIQPSDAADIQQEVLLRIHQKIPEFQPKTFKGWVWRITERKIADRFRHGQQRPKAIGGSSANRQVQNQADPDCLDPGDDADGLPYIDADCLIVRQVLKVIRRDFAQQTFDAFWRTAVEGQSAPEAAEALGMTVPAVRQAKCRILKRLREELEGVF